jgi:hypothetical protein
MFVLWCVKTVVWTISGMKDKKGLNSTKNGLKGKTPGINKKKSHQGHGCLSVVSVVCCQVEVSATSWSLVQRSPTECVCVWVWSWSLDNEEALAH